MKKILMLILALIMLWTAISAVTMKIAVLPLKRLDRASEYIRKMLTVRDLEQTFKKSDHFELKDMKEVERYFKNAKLGDVESLGKEQLARIAKDLGVEFVVVGTISSRGNEFTVAMRLFSTRTNELRPISFNVVKQRDPRWAVLEKVFLKNLDDFISSEIDKLYNIAMNNYSSGDFPTAETGYLSVIELDPARTDAYFYLADVYYRLKKYTQAKTYVDRHLSFDPNNIKTLELLVKIYEETNDLTNRIKTMEKVAELTSDAELYLLIGNTYIQNNQVNNAIIALKKAVQVDPEFTAAMYRLAFLFYDENRFSEAIEYLEFAYNRFPENDIIARRLAISYQKTGRINEAIAKYEQVIQNNPENVQAYLNIVSLYRMLAGDAPDAAAATQYYNKALEAMNNLKRINPENALAYLNLASIYLAQNKLPEAETNANLAISKDSSLYQSYVILGTINQTRGTEQYNRFVDLEKRAAEAVGRQATTLKQQRDAAKEQANALFKKADEMLKNARSRTTDQEVLNDINRRISAVAQLIGQTN